ncbi:MAG: motility associated factor glycosyltransferase family protein [Nitrospinae bacterium]|nr:motility associated factor glycosyltransferase family protein [Nitrospinota bacterium]
MDIERFISPYIPTQMVRQAHHASVGMSNIDVLTAKNGCVTAKCNGILLHSSYNPMKEGDKFAETSDIKKGDSVLLYGFGMGYHVDSILKAIGKDGNILIIELNREVLSAAFAYRDLSEMLSHSNLWIITGDNESEVSTAFLQYISSNWGSLPEDNKKVVIFSPSLKCMPQGFDGIRNAFNMLLMERRFPALLGDIENRNLRLNRDVVLNSEGVKGLFGKYKGMTGILVSSGPSLDIVIPELKSMMSLSNPSGKAVIMAVDSALHALVKNDIKPDFVISIDPQDYSFVHLIDYFEADIPLIFLPSSNPVLVKNYKGKKFVALKYEGQGARGKGQGIIEDKGYTEGGGSVSCIALDMLIKLGANPIILAGQDCAFPGNRFYSNAVSEGERWLDSVNGFYLLKDIHNEKIIGQKIIYVSDRFGRKIPTHENLYRYIRYIEEIVKKEGDISFYNLNSKSVGFMGVEDISSLNSVITG